MSSFLSGDIFLKEGAHLSCMKYSCGQRRWSEMLSSGLVLSAIWVISEISGNISDAHPFVRN